MDRQGGGQLAGGRHGDAVVRFDLTVEASTLNAQTPPPPPNQTSSSGAIDLIAMASTMFSIFYGVWWGTLLAAVSQRAAQTTSNGDAILYQEWLKESAILVAFLIIVLSIHALVVAHLRLWQASRARFVAECVLVVLLGKLALWLSGGFLDDTVRKFSLDESIASNGKSLLWYWVLATWVLVALRQLYVGAVGPRLQRWTTLLRRRTRAAGQLLAQFEQQLERQHAQRGQ